MMLLAQIALATVVQADIEYFNPSKRGYLGINEAEVMKNYKKRSII